jgi:hypothetical protein
MNNLNNATTAAHIFVDHLELFETKKSNAVGITFGIIGGIAGLVVVAIVAYYVIKRKDSSLSLSFKNKNSA